MSEIQLSPTALVETEFCRKSYRVIAAPTVNVEDLTRPAFWGHVAMRLRAGDLIEVLAEDNSFYAEVLVRSARRLDATVSILRFVKLEKPELDASIIDGYEIKFRGARAKFTVLRGKDVLKDGFDTEEMAQAYLNAHLKAMAA